MNVIDVGSIRAKLARVEPRYRLASAIGQVCGIGTPAYGPMVNQVNALRMKPGWAAEDAAYLAADFSLATARQRLEHVTAILAAVEGFELNDEHERPGDVVPALARYREELHILLEST
jgi:hypothetical protein